MGEIPGFVVKHRIITPQCRANKGDSACGHEVLKELPGAVFGALKGWPIDSAVKIHVVVTIEREAKENEDEQT